MIRLSRKSAKLQIARMCIVALSGMPLTAFAAPETLRALIQMLIDISGYVLVLLYVGAVLLFLVGIAQFLMNTEDEEKQREGKKWIFWGVIAIFAGISVWGIVKIFVATFDLSGLFIPQLPG